MIACVSLGLCGVCSAAGVVAARLLLPGLPRWQTFGIGLAVGLVLAVIAARFVDRWMGRNERA